MHESINPRFCRDDEPEIIKGGCRNPHIYFEHGADFHDPPITRNCCGLYGITWIREKLGLPQVSVDAIAAEMGIDIDNPEFKGIMTSDLERIVAKFLPCNVAIIEGQSEEMPGSSSTAVKVTILRQLRGGLPVDGDANVPIAHRFGMVCWTSNHGIGIDIIDHWWTFKYAEEYPLPFEVTDWVRAFRWYLQDTKKDLSARYVTTNISAVKRMLEGAIDHDMSLMEFLLHKAKIKLHCRKTPPIIKTLFEFIDVMRVAMEGMPLPDMYVGERPWQGEFRGYLKRTELDITIFEIYDTHQIADRIVPDYIMDVNQLRDFFHNRSDGEEDPFEVDGNVASQLVSFVEEVAEADDASG